EPRNGFYDRVLHPLVLALLAEVPPRRRLELHVELLFLRDQLLAGHGKERSPAAQLLGDLLGEGRIPLYLLDHSRRNGLDVDRLGSYGLPRRRLDRTRWRPDLVDAAAVVVIAGEDVIEDDARLAIPDLLVIGVGQLFEDVLDHDARCLAGLGLAAPVEDETVLDVVHQLARDDLHPLALLLVQRWIRPGEEIEHRELGLR